MAYTQNPEVADALGVTYISDRQVAERYGVSRPTIWAWVKTDDSFPKPTKLSPGCTRWKLDELLEWENARRAA
ncbi:AlpA family phage regulatory protein [Salipiger sp. 1_MG-2023]|uniref:helix-turn-helix transcriptional regulator n=1 Tax=Salipiger sp. 1_MG-2023 TaxID=3062665 RepID=UPI0026E1CD4A|nr:AlpA family phage regulatory protein [Salipiger sp. 1_MG-2023]MDO6584818.1 AlpA family phage regulatory protein [Salipiger sp. 1_MG-2023]